MAGPSWLFDGNRIATKIKCASVACDPGRVNWKSNPSKACPKCQHISDNSDVSQEWPGLPRGVKFDPSDQEIVWHLLAKVGAENFQPHPFISEFISTVDKDEGICYTHPQNLPGVKKDGSVSHFFHRAIKAYNSGTRKRRKIHGDNFGDVRWHKTGKTKSVVLDGVQKGCKKIMVLYLGPVKGAKTEKTNWVMHQYHLGAGEDEKEGDHVISKVFYQQQPIKQGEKSEDIPEDIDPMIPKVDPITPKSVIPETPHNERPLRDFDLVQEYTSCIDPSAQHHEMGYIEEDMEAEFEMPGRKDILPSENHGNQVVDNNDNQGGGDSKWWDSESQYLLDSQQLVEGLSLCDEFLQSQSPNRDRNENDQAKKGKPLLSDYAHLGPENLKRDLEECQDLALDPTNLELDTPLDFRLSQLLQSQSPNRDRNENDQAKKGKPLLVDYPHLGPENVKKDLEDCQALAFDPTNLELDTPPDFRLSQLEFGSQESFLAWGGN